MGLRIDNANVVTTDIDTSNGVIHVIDQVLFRNKYKKAGEYAVCRLVDGLVF